eukprot:6175682-Pleurochrysis_carterae.AAC.3
MLYVTSVSSVPTSDNPCQVNEIAASAIHCRKISVQSHKSHATQKPLMSSAASLSESLRTIACNFHLQRERASQQWHHLFLHGGLKRKMLFAVKGQSRNGAFNRVRAGCFIL